MFDRAGFSTLHFAIYKNKTIAAQLLIKYVYQMEQDLLEDSDTSKDQVNQMLSYSFKEWIDLKCRGNQDLSAIHFAAFNGNIELLRNLVAHGANINS